MSLPCGLMFQAHPVARGRISLARLLESCTSPSRPFCCSPSTSGGKGALSGRPRTQEVRWRADTRRHCARLPGRMRHFCLHICVEFVACQFVRVLSPGPGPPRKPAPPLVRVFIFYFVPAKARRCLRRRTNERYRTHMAQWREVRRPPLVAR